MIIKAFLFYEYAAPIVLVLLFAVAHRDLNLGSFVNIASESEMLTQGITCSCFFPTRNF